MNLIDLHTHTISSGHAYSTLEENIKGAKKKGLKIMGMSDHATSLPGAPHIFHFFNMKVIPKVIEDVRILKGIEANIIDFSGKIDVDEDISKHLDYVIASLHPPVIKPGKKEENTQALLKAMENPLVNIIGHPDDGRYPIDYEAVVLKAKATHTLLEINNASLNPEGSRVDTLKHSETILKLCMIHNVPVIFGSDAHISFDVGNFELCTALAEKLHFPQSLIVNQDIKTLSKYLNVKL